MKERKGTLEQALEEAVSRALRDNLAPLQRTADDLHQAYADLVAACSSSRPSNALPAMLRAQTAASALAAGLSVLSNFVAVALNPRDGKGSEEHSATTVTEWEPEPVALEPPPLRVPPPPELKSDWVEEPPATQPVEDAVEAPAQIPVPAAVIEEPVATEPVASAETPHETGVFDPSTLPAELRDLHRRASRVAKVAMQDIKLLRPKDVRLGRENKDICHRLRSDIDKARKEYDRRFRAIQDHPVDYFRHWMLEILAEGDAEALGEYPYPSPVLRH
ncbi:MAG: hypothetical protein WCC21_00125 [Candidatus Acidiferrales bacterium]